MSIRLEPKERYPVVNILSPAVSGERVVPVRCQKGSAVKYPAGLVERG